MTKLGKPTEMFAWRHPGARNQRRAAHWGVTGTAMAFQPVGMDEVTRESRERRSRTEVSGNTTVLKEWPVRSEERQEV